MLIHNPRLVQQHTAAIGVSLGRVVTRWFNVSSNVNLGKKRRKEGGGKSEKGEGRRKQREGRREKGAGRRKAGSRQKEGGEKGKYSEIAMKMKMAVNCA